MKGEQGSGRVAVWDPFWFIREMFRWGSASAAAIFDVAATQKSGYLHVIDATTMKPVWTKQLFVTLSFLGGNICRIATDGKTLYLSANPGVLYALDAETGATKWMSPLGGTPMKGGNVQRSTVGLISVLGLLILNTFSAGL